MAQYIPVAAAALPLVQAVPGILKEFIEVGKEFWPNYEQSEAPRVKYEELQKFKKENELNHQKSMASLEELRRQAQESSEKQQHAADKRIKDQRAENDNILKTMREKIKEREDQYDEEIKRLSNDHTEKMKTLRSETKEEREKADRDHAAKVNRIEKEHKEAVKIAQEKLEATKREGEKKIQEAEREKDAITKQRNEVLEVFGKEMGKLMEENQKQVLLIQKANNDLRIKNIEDTKKQIEEKSELRIKQIELGTKNLIANLSLETNRSVIGEFRKLMYPVNAIRDLSNHVEEQCLPAYEGAMVSVLPGIVSPDIDAMKMNKAMFKSRMERFDGFIRDSPLTHPVIYKACHELSRDMARLIDNRELGFLLAKLENAIDLNDARGIIHFGMVAKKMREDLASLNDKIDKTLNAGEMQRLHDGEASSDKVPAIKNGNAHN